MYAFSLFCVKSHYASRCTLADVSPNFLVFLLYYKSDACFEKLHSDTALSLCRCPFVTFRPLPAYLNTGTLILLQVEGPTEYSLWHFLSFLFSLVHEELLNSEPLTLTLTLT